LSTLPIELDVLLKKKVGFHPISATFRID